LREKIDSGILFSIQSYTGKRTHNPLVLGSSPSCPTFSTHTSEQVFSHYANVAKTSFYAIFTQSTTNNQRNSKQYHFLPTNFSKIFSYFPIFSWEQWEFWERNSFSFHFQQPGAGFWRCKYENGVLQISLEGVVIAEGENYDYFEALAPSYLYDDFLPQLKRFCIDNLSWFPDPKKC
jgi:hypothetical protein